MARRSSARAGDPYPPSQKGVYRHSSGSPGDWIRLGFAEEGAFPFFDRFWGEGREFDAAPAVWKLEWGKIVGEI